MKEHRSGRGVVVPRSIPKSAEIVSVLSEWKQSTAKSVSQVYHGHARRVRVEGGGERI